MPWHIYPYRLRLEHGTGPNPDALVLLVQDQNETSHAFAEAWATRFPNTQFSLLTVDSGEPDPGQREHEKLSTLINWELVWTGLWHCKRLVLAGIGIGSHIALRLASKCSSCAGVVACAAEFPIGDPVGALARTPLRLIRCAPGQGMQVIHPFERTVRRLRRQNADFEAATVDMALGDAENVIARLGGNYLSDLLSTAGSAEPEMASKLHSGCRTW